MDLESGLAFAAIASILLLAPGGCLLTAFFSSTKLPRAIEIRSFSTLITTVILSFSIHVIANSVLILLNSLNSKLKPLIPVFSDDLYWKPGHGLMVRMAHDIGNTTFLNYVFSYGAFNIFIYTFVLVTASITIGWLCGKTFTLTRLPIPIGSLGFIYGSVEPYVRLKNVKASVMVKCNLENFFLIYEGGLHDLGISRRNRFDYVVLSAPQRRLLRIQSEKGTTPDFTFGPPHEISFEKNDRNEVPASGQNPDMKRIFIDGEDIMNIVFEHFTQYKASDSGVAAKPIDSEKVDI